MKTIFKLLFSQCCERLRQIIADDRKSPADEFSLCLAILLFIREKRANTVNAILWVVIKDHNCNKKIIQSPHSGISPNRVGTDSFENGAVTFERIGKTLERKKKDTHTNPHPHPHAHARTHAHTY